MELLNLDQEKFKATCEKYNLSLVILHGSYVAGTATPQSDIDIGFLGEPDIIKEKYFDILRDFSDFFGDKFDPVVLNGAEAMITYHVALNGIPLYEKRKGLFNSFKAGALVRYADTKKFRLLERKYVKQAVQKME